MIQWKPHPRQIKALERSEFEVLYGGARGGGKTDAGIVWMQKTFDNPRFRGLVIRKNSDDLKDWIDRARYMYSGWKVEVVGSPPEIRVPNGAKIRTGHLKDDSAYEKYQGHEYQRILIEELTQIPDEKRYLMLISSCRSTLADLEARVFATTNPGGVGHHWVKKRFIDGIPYNTVHFDSVTGRDRIFIPAKVFDNPTVMKRDPAYFRMLKGLPSELRKAWLDGSWDVFEGMYFKEFDREYHVYDPRDIHLEPSWPRFRSIDWGFRDPMACYWHAIGPDNHIFTYREYYQTEKLDIEAAKEIKALSEHENVQYTVGDPQSFPVRIPQFKFGKQISVPRYTVWEEAGVPIKMGDSDRITGWSHMRDYLLLRDVRGCVEPTWHISSQCTNLIEEIASAVYDDKKVEDVSSKSRDHALESCRLGLMSRPKIRAPQLKQLDPIRETIRYFEQKRSRAGKNLGLI